MPANALTVTATYKDLPPSTYTVNLQSDGNGTAKANLPTAASGTKINLSTTPNSGYKFKEWQVVNGNVAISNNSFTMPSANVKIKAVFEQIPATIAPPADSTPSTSSITTPMTDENADNDTQASVEDATISGDGTADPAVSEPDSGNGIGFNWPWIAFIGFAAVATGGNRAHSHKKEKVQYDNNSKVFCGNCETQRYRPVQNSVPIAEKQSDEAHPQQTLFKKRQQLEFSTVG